MSKPNRYIVFALAGQRAGPVSIEMTDDLVTRLRQQKMGRLSQSQFRLDRLVYVEEFSCAVKAKRRAESLRRTSIDWLLSFLLSRNPNWRDLSVSLNQCVA